MGMMQRRKRLIRELSRELPKPIPSWRKVRNWVDGPFGQIILGLADVSAIWRKARRSMAKPRFGNLEAAQVDHINGNRTAVGFDWMAWADQVNASPGAIRVTVEGCPPHPAQQA